MNTTTFALVLVALLLILVVLCLGVCLVVVLLQDNRTMDFTERMEESQTIPVVQRKWHLELWDIGIGCCFVAEFDGGVTLGRGLPGMIQYGRVPIGDDLRISRNQSQIYEQDNCLYLWNLSEVNQTLLNGNAVTHPAILHIGDRLVMGGHTFLLTLIQRAQQTD